MVVVGRQVQHQGPAPLHAGVGDEERVLPLAAVDVDHAAGLARPGRGVAADHRVTHTQGLVGQDELVEHVGAPLHAVLHHKFFRRVGAVDESARVIAWLMADFSFT